jgi:hypothetical protein
MHLVSNAVRTNETATEKIITDEIMRRMHAGFQGSMTIHFNHGVPTQIEARELLGVKDLRTQKD